MKYFKMRESKRKISFIMALALIVSLLPVSPVVKAADVKKIVYVDNKLGDDVVKVVVNESTTASGSAIVNVTAVQGEFSGTEGEITITAAKKEANSEVPTAGAFEVSPATNSAISFEYSKAAYDATGKVWSATITGIYADDVVVKVDGTYNPSIVPGSTNEPNMTATTSAISDTMVDSLLKLNVITKEQADAVKATKATLELKAKADTTVMNDADKTAIESYLSKNPTIENLVKSFLNANNSFVFDLTIDLVFKKDGKETIIQNVSDLGEAIEITMEIPEACRNKNASKLRTYFVIRLHNGEARRIDCETSGNNFSFKNDKFSKFILCYKDVNSSWNGGATLPPTGTTKPGATATPSASPSASAVPSATPVATTVPTGTNTPTDGTGTTGGNNNPGVNDPGNGGSSGNTTGSSSKVKKGQKYTVNGIKYEIISTDSTKTVGFANGKKNSKKITIPATVKIKGKTFKVKSIKSNAFKNSKKLTTLVIGANVKIIEKNAFKGCKNLKKITIKSKKLTAAKVAKNAFKGINKKATVKVPKNKVKAYTKIVKVKGGAGNSVKVTK